MLANLFYACTQHLNYIILQTQTQIILINVPILLNCLLASQSMTDIFMISVSVCVPALILVFCLRDKYIHHALDNIQMYTQQLQHIIPSHAMLSLHYQYCAVIQRQMAWKPLFTFIFFLFFIVFSTLHAMKYARMFSLLYYISPYCIISAIFHSRHQKFPQKILFLETFAPADNKNKTLTDTNTDPDPNLDPDVDHQHVHHLDSHQNHDLDLDPDQDPNIFFDHGPHHDHYLDPHHDHEIDPDLDLTFELFPLPKWKRLKK